MRSCWRPPDVGWVKINFDGAVFRDGMEGGCGVVAQSDSGQCVVWAAFRFVQPVFPELAEALATREAVSLALRMGWRSVIFEGDCVSLIHKLQSNSGDLFVIGRVVRDIKFLVSSFSHSFSLVRRTGNRVTHSIARTAGTYIILFYFIFLVKPLYKITL